MAKKVNDYFPLRVEEGGLSYQITERQRHLSIISLGVVSSSQAGGGVGGEVHLLGQVEDADVIVHGAWIISGVNNQLLHFEVQLGQISLALFFPIVFSKCDLIRKYIILTCLILDNM